MSGDLQVKLLEPKTVTDAEIEDVTQTCAKAFVEFNTSISAHPEMIGGDFGDARTASMVLSWFCKTHNASAATDGDGKIVGVSFIDVAAKGSKVASLGPVSSIVAGSGKQTFEAACAHAEGLGFSTLVLMQIASSSRSFALFAKLGFEAKHTCQYVGGFLPSSGSSAPTEDEGGPSLTPMAAADVPECAELFLRAHGAGNGWDRQADIARMLESGFPFAMLVARGADGKVVGYSTGFFLMGHQVSVSQDVFCAMYKEASRVHQERGLPSPRFHAPMEFPGLMSWSLAQKLTVFRATIIMARGTYEHAWPGSGLVVTPGVTGW